MKKKILHGGGQDLHKNSSFQLSLVILSKIKNSRTQIKYFNLENHIFRKGVFSKAGFSTREGLGINA